LNKEEYARRGIRQLKLVNFNLDVEILQALSNFLKNTSHGTFTLVVQESKVIGYDIQVKKRCRKININKADRKTEAKNH